MLSLLLVLWSLGHPGIDTWTKTNIHRLQTTGWEVRPNIDPTQGALGWVGAACDLGFLNAQRHVCRAQPQPRPRVESSTERTPL